ncbi:hypothetical protein SAMN05660964_01584 [Thiothrix caldifontis]|uniref:Uncharacterized protein n=1 Tax=Thiothrix caldifontis TaxID=525918 RepID=A0A1H4B3P3_9GAMM|nr:hypothetical protein [Thiothrix caldifontis]SEA42686.1 hypothetical protein SAMN05660964_01584 [Thiothrix caldifontis]
MSQYPHGDPIEEARLLLPWFITGKLSGPERKLVESVLAKYPELADEYRRELKMVDMIRANTALLELSAVDTTQQRLETLMKRIEREEHTENVPQAPPQPLTPQLTWLQGLQQKLHHFFSNTSWLIPANAVFASLLLIQAGFLGWFVYTNSASQEGIQDSIYVTATATDDSSVVPLVKGMVLLVDFNGEAQVNQVREFLLRWNARIVDGPESGGLFKIEVKDVSPSAQESDAILQQMGQDNTVVAFIGREY